MVIQKNMHAPDGFKAMVGTPSEVRDKLEYSHAMKVMVIAFEGLDPGELASIKEEAITLARKFHLKREAKKKSEVDEADRWARLRERQRAMQMRGLEEVRKASQWLTAAEVSARAGFSEINPSSQPSKWKSAGKIFTIRDNGTNLFPEYGFSLQEEGYRPVKALAEIIEIFMHQKDGWGMAYWFAGHNGFLGGERPQDLLQLDPKRVIAAAYQEAKDCGNG